MPLHYLIPVIVALLLAVDSGATWAEAPGASLDFNRDIRPILSNKCFNCHGPDAKSREAGLRLDLREAAVAELESGATAIVPGKVDESELIRRIRSEDSGERMPPAEGGKPLTAAEIAKLEAWIAQGAKYEKHWSFVPPVRPELPAVKNQAWVRGPIDHFVLARLEQAGLAPAAEASREAQIRRVAFDLTGLPPTLAEIDAFLADTATQAYERMVDRYLNSPAYGEHMARGWLDLARYADSNGYQYDTERTQWVWRDWVIDAYNRNLPFDQFTIEQLAGDLLPNATPQQRLATGFNRNHGVTIEGGVIDEEYRTEYVMDRLATTGTAWMGLTIGCARCHDHKFDPLSQKEFYQLYAFFNQVPERGFNGFDPRESIPSPLADQTQQALDAQIAKTRAQLDRVAAPKQAEIDAWAAQLASATDASWTILEPQEMKSAGGSTLTKLEDQSVLVGGATPARDVYEISAVSDAKELTAVRLEALAHESLPGGGPGRHSNSNFVLSEFELTASSLQDPQKSQVVKFVRAIADYSQAGYPIAFAIDGSVAGNNGWAVDGPVRKLPATAVFIAEKPFGFEGGTLLRFRLQHQAGFGQHGIGRPRFAVTNRPSKDLELKLAPADILAIARKPAAERTPEEREKLRLHYVSLHSDEAKLLTTEIAALEKEKAQSAAYPPTMIMRELPKPRPTRVLDRGQYDAPGEPVEPNVPAVFPPLPTDQPPNRLALAKWLVDPAHPLTARVAVNRYWQRMFGLGLVKTSEDFGAQGELPSHPELLDWLATEFIRSGWNIKHIYRLIVTSAAYRQSSHAGKAAYERDPENRLLARGPRNRLEAEEIRDAALAASGLLVQKIGGPSVYPYQPAGLWTELNNRPGFSQEYKQGHGDDLYRRSVYSFWKRSVPLPMLKTFDAPDRDVCTVQRSRTNTPLQSLLLLHGPQFVEAARNLGQRMLAAAAANDEERLTLGFRLATGRRPTASEVDLLREHLTAERARFALDESAARLSLEVGESPRDEASDVVELAAWTSVARLLLNLDEFVSKE